MERCSLTKHLFEVFNKFTQAGNHRFFTSLQHWFFRELPLKNLTLDFDSSVVTLYGDQQGATKGYNPAKPGRDSRHPLFAFGSRDTDGFKRMAASG